MIDNLTRNTYNNHCGRRREMGKVRKNYLNGIDLEALENIACAKEHLTYAILCKRINIEPLTGDGKKRQIMELEQICDFEKRKKIFCFFGMKNIEEVRQSKSKNIKLTYSELIENLLIGYMLDKNKDEIFLTAKDLFNITGMANKNYSFVKYGIKDIDKKKAIIMAHKGEFNNYELNQMVLNLYSNIFKDILLKSIQDINLNGRILIERGYIGVFKNSDDKSTMNIRPNSKDGAVLTEISNQCLKEMRCKNMRDVFLLYGNTNYYYKKREVKCKEKTRYSNFYDCYVATIHESVEYQYNYELLLSKMNEKIKNKVRNNKVFLSNISVTGLKNLTNALVNINTKYDFEYDYLKNKEGK